MNKNKQIVVSILAAAVLIPSCKSEKKEEAASGAKTTESTTDKPSEKVAGEVIKIDGSSTVFPITQAVAEEFQIERGGRVTVGVSGTGGGFKKFCRGETALSGASRPIKPTEVEMCKAAGIEFIELPIAFFAKVVVKCDDEVWLVVNDEY